ncbi:class C sortase [Trueperella pyogenes]|uniref:class C sortase n=1 Tax=Trueperella pyogenes TaxID=1661 RepID=UPI00345D53DE
MLDTTQANAAPKLEPRAETSARPKKHGMLMPIFVVLIGITVLLYPVIATQWNNIQQQEVASEYKSFVKEADTAQLEDSLKRAHEYNKNRTVGPILDPWTARLSDDNEPYKEYLEQLNLSGTMARIVIPSIHVDLPVFHGTRPDTLEQGIGHLFGTDLPIGGKNTHSVLTGHTGLQTATLFDNLKDVKEGASIYVDVYGEKLRYVVYGTEVVLPEEAQNLYKVEGKDLLTLITCTPYGINSHRLLVHAERAPMDEQAAQELDEASGFTLQWWMWLFIAGAVLAMLALMWYVRKSKRQVDDAVVAPETATAAGTTTASDSDQFNDIIFGTQGERE